MCTRLSLALAFVAAIVLTNVAAAADITYGVRVVVIDPGHGGKLPGAHYGGVYEKDIVLNVALRLGRLIEREMPGVKVVYTRRTDKMLGETLADDLQARATIANEAGGDLFISIHANAAPSTAARGVETLVMGETPKEQRYNENALFESNREDLIDMSDERTAAIVRAYIQNLQFTYGEYSMAIARCIERNYRKAGRHVRGIKPQLLRVLYATDMPGVLTEIGFMSNAQELAYMKSEKGQAEIARSLFDAVRDYSDYLLAMHRGDEGVSGGPMSSGGAEPSVSAESPSTDETAGAGAALAVGTDAKPATRNDGLFKMPKAEDSKREERQSETPKSSESSESAAGVRTGSVESAGEVRYAVQILAAPKALPLDSSQFRSYRGKVKQYAGSGALPYKYCVEECSSAARAQQRLREVRRVFPDAFVVRCRDGRIVTR